MKVYISHSSAEQKLASDISEWLVGMEGLEVFDPASDILPGDNWASVISEALSSSEAMVVLLSPDAVESPNVIHEIGFALGSPNYKGRIVPVLARPTDDVPWYLRTIQMIDGRSTQNIPRAVGRAMSRLRGRARA